MPALTVFTAAQACAWAHCGRDLIDDACASGALRAADSTPKSSKRHWRILSDDLENWVRSGMPTEARA